MSMGGWEQREWSPCTPAVINHRVSANVDFSVNKTFLKLVYKCVKFKYGDGSWELKIKLRREDIGHLTIYPQKQINSPCFPKRSPDGTAHNKRLS